MPGLDSSDYSFESVAFSPEQFFANGLKVGEPIERLMFALLDDAIRCYQTNVGVQRPQARRALVETEKWLFGLPGHLPFSIESVCEVLQIDTPRLQRALLKWRERKLAGRRF
jgi:hypothetical protein